MNFKDTEETCFLLYRFPMFRFGRNANAANTRPYSDLLQGRVAEHFETLLQYLLVGGFFASIVHPFYEHVSKVPLMQQFLECILFTNTYALFDPTLVNIAKIYMCANACVCLVRSTFPKELAIGLITLLLTVSNRFGFFGSVIFLEDSLVSCGRAYNLELKLTSLEIMMWAFAAAFVFFGQCSFEDFALPFVFYVTVEYMDKGVIPISYAFLALWVSHEWTLVKCARRNVNQQAQRRFGLQNDQLVEGVVREITAEYRSRR